MRRFLSTCRGTGSRSVSSISMPIAPRPPPASCACGLPRWPTCCCAPAPHRAASHTVRQSDLGHHSSQATQDRRPRASECPPHQGRDGSLQVASGLHRSKTWVVRLVPLRLGISLARLSFVRIGSCQGDDPRLTRPTVHAGTLNPGTNPYQSRWGCEPRRRGGAALMKFNGAQDRWLLSDRVGD